MTPSGTSKETIVSRSPSNEKVRSGGGDRFSFFCLRPEEEEEEEEEEEDDICSLI
jgi:hypothetical protein